MSGYVRIRGIAVDMTSRNSCDQLGGVPEQAGNRIDVHATLEAVARVGRETELLPGGANATCIERCNLEQEVGRLFGDFASLSAYYSSDRNCILCIGNHRHRLIELAIDTIERDEFLALTRAAHDHLPTLELGEVERVHRLTEAMKHVVRGVDDIADRAAADRFDSLAHPVGTGSYGDTAYRCGHVARSAFAVFDCDRDAGHLRIGGSPSKNGRRMLWPLHLFASRGSDLAGQTFM